MFPIIAQCQGTKSTLVLILRVISLCKPSRTLGKQGKDHIPPDSFDGDGSPCMCGSREYIGTLYFPLNFAVNPKTALENKIYSKINYFVTQTV
jgi:hypothetical protein